MEVIELEQRLFHDAVMQLRHALERSRPLLQCDNSRQAHRDAEQAYDNLQRARQIVLTAQRAHP